MNDGLNIRKISTPIFGASKVKPVKRENRDSRKKHFQRHFEDEKKNKSEGGLTSDTGKLQREFGGKEGKDDSDGVKAPDSLNKNLGKRIDIHV